MKKRFSLGSGLTMAGMVILAAVLTLLLPMTEGAKQTPETAPQEQAASQGEQTRVAEGCELLQTLRYTRCQHEVVRRVTAPAELIGKTLAQVQPLYEDWQITEFAPKEIKMEKTPDMFCPDHMVLMPGGDGRLCVFQNKYGDALALVNELDMELSALPSALQEEVRLGIGFPTLAELEQWLESAES